MIRQYHRIERVQLPIHRQIPFESSNYRVANCCGFRAPSPTPSTAPLSSEGNYKGERISQRTRHEYLITPRLFG